MNSWFHQQAGMHFSSARAALVATPWPVYVLPFLAIGAIIVVQNSPIGWITEKPVQEIVAPTVLTLAAATVLLVHYWVRETFTLMEALFVWALYLRELHFEFMNGGIFFALAALMWWLSTVRVQLADWLAEYPIRLCLAGGFFTYFLSDMIDRHLFSFMPYYRTWNDNVEETLKTCGHLFIFALVIFTLRAGLKFHFRSSQAGKPS